MSSAGNRENEIKLNLESPQAGLDLLARAGFHESKPRVFESNAVFDTPEGIIRGAGKLLRLRSVGGDAILTYKGPAAASRHKSREELETRVGDFNISRAILERLGYRIIFLYEKFRTEFEAAGQVGTATVDETPIGVFMELEGAPEWIDAIAGRLGFREEDYITLSYGALYANWCAERGVPPGNMVFDTGIVQA